MKRYLPFVIVAAVALIAAGSGVLLYQKHKLTPGTTNNSTTDAADKGAHILGNPKAQVTIEEYGDYQCPPCGMLAQPLGELVQEFSPRVRLIFRNFPLPNHQHAREAAQAAEAAGLQGKFWEMHDEIYKEQGVWTKANSVQFLFNSYANMIGLDVQRFTLDSATESVRDIVENDAQRGKAAGVRNTPTVFIDGTEVAPKDLNPATLHTLIEAALNAKNSSPTQK